MEQSLKLQQAKKKEYSHSFNTKAKEGAETHKLRSSILNSDTLNRLEKNKVSVFNSDRKVTKAKGPSSYEKFKNAYKKSIITSKRPSLQLVKEEKRILTETKDHDFDNPLSSHRSRFNTDTFESPMPKKLAKTQTGSKKEKPFKKPIKKSPTFKADEPKKFAHKKDSVNNEILNSIRTLGNLLNTDTSKVQSSPEVVQLNTLLQLTKAAPRNRNCHREILKQAFVESVNGESEAEEEEDEEVDSQADARIKKYSLLFNFINSNLQEIGTMMIDNIEGKPNKTNNEPNYILSTTNFKDELSEHNVTIKEGIKETENSYLRQEAKDESSDDECERTMVELVEPVNENLSKLQALKSKPKPTDILVGNDNQLHEEMRSMFISSLHGDFYQNIMDQTMARHFGDLSIMEEVEKDLEVNFDELLFN